MSDAGGIRRHVLADGDVSVAILSLGCITQDWRVPVGKTHVPVVLGYASAQDYRANPGFLGVIAGRVANRVSGAGFGSGADRIGLDVNEPPNHLHGGAHGLHARNWRMEPDGNRALRLDLVSPHGDQGYPGRVAFRVTISLRGYTLHYDMRADADRVTPVNLAQHSYYNLMGKGLIWDHVLQIDADRHTPVDDAMIPTGKTAPLTGEPFDFRQARSLARADPGRRGLDMNFVLRGGAGAAATLRAPNGLKLAITTDQPCLQLYTGAGLRRVATPLAGQHHAGFGGVCLEPQQFPDSPNQPGFASVMIAPDRPYRQKLAVRITPADVP